MQPPPAEAATPADPRARLRPTPTPPCRAQQVADRLLPAYNTPTGIPLNMINLRTGEAKNPTWNQR